MGRNMTSVRIFCFVGVILSFAADAYAQTSGDNATTSYPNSDITTVTTVTDDITGSGEDPCSGCESGDVCPDGCECGENLAKDMDGKCAEPCKIGNNWCPHGEACLRVTGGQKYICSEPCQGGHTWCTEEEGVCIPGGNAGFICSEPCKDETGGVTIDWCPGSGQTCIASETNEGYSCECEANYYLSPEEQCLSAKIFGGEMTFEEEYVEEKRNETEQSVLTVLDDMFNETQGYIKSEVLGLSSGSTIAKYKLIYEINSAVTDNDVKASYESYTGGNCNTTYETGEALTINCTASRMTVIDPAVGCAAASLNCDNQSALCSSANGSTICDCKDPIRSAKPYSGANYCTVITCIDDNDCNPPFGKCVKSSTVDSLNNYCDCTVFGWSGNTCTDPWEFVFTIVTAGLGLILICVLTACIITTKKGKSVKSTQKQEDLDLQNPFVDFQPGLVRAKVPTNAYSLSDSYEPVNGSHTNGAFSANEGTQMQTSTFSGDQRRPQKSDYEYF